MPLPMVGASARRARNEALIYTKSLMVAMLYEDPARVYDAFDELHKNAIGVSV